ncbi:MAG TPA: ATP-binding protein [Longimicrobiales bacterium]
MNEARPDPAPLDATRLHRPCPPGSLGFDTTEELEPLTDAFGQPDALAALSFGLAMTEPGYNIFVLGPPGTGRKTMVRRVVTAHAATRPSPPDRCFVYNFRDERHPRSLELATGRAPAFAKDMRDLVAELRDTIPDALASDAVAKRRTALLEEPQERANAELDGLRREFERDPHVALVGSPTAVMVVPARGGQPIDRESYLALPPEEREEIDRHVRDASARVATVQRHIQELTREARERIEELNRDVARSMVSFRIAALKERYRDAPTVLEYLDAVCEDVVVNAERFSTRPEERPEGALAAAALLGGAPGDDFFRRYEVNVLVTHEPGRGAPVVEEPDPHLRNLLGHLGLRVQFGAVVADIARIAPGALQRANGGYLILEAAEVLTRPLAWAALKRALRTRELRPAEATAELALAVVDSIEPEPIPGDVKVVLIGEPTLYYLLRALDTEFAELFKVKVDFRPHMDRTADAERGYARLLAAQVRSESLPPFDATAVASLIEEGSRLAGDQRKLTTRFGEIADLAREAAHWARNAGRNPVRAEDVARALEERDRRDKRAQRELLELIRRSVLAFEPAGERVGQIYGIGLLAAAGGEAFGRPIRVMASAYMGTGGVINIEREAKLSGPLHSKGFLVLSGYLGWMFARSEPLILSASLSFEQMYEEVEGDSASVAELYALLSAIGEVPVRQGIGVTGALSEKGAVLPVGGVTQKVEGFFAACQQIGLDGQGVIVPRRNADNLVLRREVRDAVEAGRFHIWAIDGVEEGWAILAGREAGERRADGTFPEGTVHHAVQARLSEWTAEWKRMVRREGRP